MLVCWCRPERPGSCRDKESLLFYLHLFPMLTESESRSVPSTQPCVRGLGVPVVPRHTRQLGPRAPGGGSTPGTPQCRREPQSRGEVSSPPSLWSTHSPPQLLYFGQGTFGSGPWVNWGKEGWGVGPESYKVKERSLERELMKVLQEGLDLEEMGRV